MERSTAHRRHRDGADHRQTRWCRRAGGGAGEGGYGSGIHPRGGQTAGAVSDQSRRSSDVLTAPPPPVHSPIAVRRAGSHVLDPPGLDPSVIDPRVSPARAHAPISTYTFSTHKFATHTAYSCLSTLSISTANRSP